MIEKPASRTLGGLIEELAVRFVDRPAVSFGEETLTFAQFRERVLQCARALLAQGVRPGEKVGILMGNRTEWLVVNFAVQYVGATMVALNTWYTAPELEYVLEHSDIAVLVVVDRFLKSDYAALLDGLEPFATRLPLLRRIVMLGERRFRSALPYEDFLQAGEAVPEREVFDALAAVSPDDLAYILYTSGSTAHPKGVTLRHRGLIENTWDIGERLRFGPDDALYLPISLFWGFGCENMLLSAWTHGVHLVLQAQFDPLDGLALIEKHRCTAVTATSNIVHAIFERPDLGGRDLSSLRKGTASGTSLSRRAVFDRFLPLACSAYGLTECYGYAAVHDAADPVDKRALTDGRPLPGFELRIFDPETNEPRAAGEVGEIRLKGHVTPAYYKNEDATRAALDANGYFKTGDLGMLDAEGYLHFKGRLKEILKSGGITVTPVEVEAVLRAHPDVVEVYVTGLPDAVLGTAVAAAVVPREGAALKDEDLVKHCRGKLAAYKIPRHYVFTSLAALPYTTTQKIHRQRLPSLFPQAKASA